MALKGRLQDFGITQLLNLINLARKTGTLYLEGVQGKAYLCFREGKLIYSHLEGEEDRLPVVLERAGKLKPERARLIATNTAGQSDRDVALMLVQANQVQQQDITRSVREHILDQVYRIFAWKEGTFRFEPADLPIQGKIIATIALENVIMEGSRRLKEWERLQEEVPNLDIALRFADRPTTPLRDINLTVKEWRVISFINPHNTIRKIAQYNSMSEFEIRKIAYSLLQAGLVEVVRAPRSVATARVEGSAEPPGQQAKPVAQRRPAVKRGLVQRLINRIREL